MAFPHMAFLVQPRPQSCSTCVHLWPNLHTSMDGFDNQMIALRFYRLNSSLKYSSTPFAVSSYVAKGHPIREVDDEVSDYNYDDIKMHSEPSFCLDSHLKGDSGGIGKLDYHHFEAVVTCSMKELRETLRRRRIGMANKGKVPWNKGRKHTPETCAKIKERTREAMRDPKVRRKLSEAPRTHSEESKKKIGSSQRLLWATRLKLKRAKEKFSYSWAESIAEAAKKGGINEEQLNWNGYEKVKKEIEAKKNEEKAKEKVNKGIQAKKRARERAQNIAEKKLALKRKQESRAKQKIPRSCNTKEKDTEVAISSELYLKSRLKKIQENKSIDEPFWTHSGVMSDLHSALGKLDIESIKEEQKRKTVSLADQIQAAKSRRQRLVRADPQKKALLGG